MTELTTYTLSVYTSADKTQVPAPTNPKVLLQTSERRMLYAAMLEIDWQGSSLLNDPAFVPSFIRATIWDADNCGYAEFGFAGRRYQLEAETNEPSKQAADASLHEATLHEAIRATAKVVAAELIRRRDERNAAKAANNPLPLTPARKKILADLASLLRHCQRTKALKSYCQGLVDMREGIRQTGVTERDMEHLARIAQAMEASEQHTEGTEAWVEAAY